MSTPAEYKRIVEKKAKQRHMKDFHPPHNIPTFSGFNTSGYGKYDHNREINWMYQPDYRARPPQPIDFTEDVMPGGYHGGYINFGAPQQNQKNGYNPNYRSYQNRNRKQEAKKKPVTILVVNETPIGMMTMDFTIDPENVICFSGKFSFLSNMFQTPLLIDGHQYSSVEHYYQSTKVFVLAGAEKAVHMVSNAAEAKSLAHKLLRSVLKNVIDDWKLKEAPKILNHAIQQKFLQNEELKAKLAATGSAILAQSFEFDNLYATGCNKKEVLDWAKENRGKGYKLPMNCHDSAIIDFIPLVGKGRNLLGAILMQVRREIIADLPVQKNSPIPRVLTSNSSNAEEEIDILIGALKMID